MTAYLLLENGMIFKGNYFGAYGEVTGEIVFTTGMTGYLETLTDQSYHGQIVLQTFPLIGNYGVIPSDFESNHIGPSAYIVKYPCQNPSNFRSENKLDMLLQERGIIGMSGIETRALTKIIRKNGVMNGRIIPRIPTESDHSIVKKYRIQDAVKKVSIENKSFYQTNSSRFTVALIDFGMKENMKRILLSLNCDVWIFPCDSTVRDILSVSPDGVVLSNGPGNPSDNKEIIENIKKLIEIKIPVFGICLGHQLLALAHGFQTIKLKYGHRGINHPVKDMETKRIYITSQNHGYAVTSDSIQSSIAYESFTHTNDGTCEGIIYKRTPTFSVQFHPEACGGPLDTAFLFGRFIKEMEVKKNAAG